MRVSQLYDLKRTQATLDFVDVDVEKDTPVFVSPMALESLPSEWGDECVYLVQNYFRYVLKLIQTGKNSEAEALLRELHEPNETHLGLSIERSRGRALGNTSAHNVWDSLSQSRAAASGLLEDLEDTVLMVDGISIDIVSDITTNIIRGPLIRYTQERCRWHGIPMEQEVNSGSLWNPEKHRWESKLVELPIAGGMRLMLVPKSIVRQHLDFNPDEYYRHYLLEHLQDAELGANSSLVQLLKNGRRRVTKKSLMDKFGTGKSTIITQTRENPEVLVKYKQDKKASPQPLLTHEDLAAIETIPEPNWEQLLLGVTGLTPGDTDAHKYETAVEALMTALFYPFLSYPVPQAKLHDGRKRVDIRYTNTAKSGFFQWLSANYTAPQIFFECKNYGRELRNPELDQLSSRFSPSRGQVGIIVCRSFENKELFLERCRDTAKDGRGFVIPLDDEDLRTLIESKKTDSSFERLSLLQERFEYLIN
jgi:hypothetical protein